MADDRNRMRRGTVLAVVAVALAVVVVTHARHGPPFNWDDHGQYLSHARALLEGRSYGDIGFIYTARNNFIGPVVEPPGMPLLVAPALLISGDSLLPVRIVLLLALAILLALIWRFAIRHVGDRAALAAVVVALAGFSAGHVLDGVMADVPFVAAIWATLLVGDSPSALTRRQLVGLAAAGTVAFAFRLAAIALLPSLVLYALPRPRAEWRGLALVGLAWTVAAMLLFFAIPAGTAVASEAGRSIPAMVRDVGDNLLAVRDGALGMYLYPFGRNRANDAWHAVALLVTAIGLVDLVRRRPWSFPNAFAICYVAMLGLLPINAARYWWPLVPLQLVALARGGEILAARLRVRAVTAVTTIGVAGAFMLSEVRTASLTTVPLFARPEMKQLVAALRSAAPGDSLRVSFFSPRQFTWYTRIPAMGQFRATPDETISELRAHGITFVVIGSFGEQRRYDASMERAVVERPEDYVMVADFGPLSLYRLRP